MRLATVIIHLLRRSKESRPARVTQSRAGGVWLKLLREDARAVGEGFELQSVPARVEEEHRGLLARLAAEADVGLDDERDARAPHALGQLFEQRGGDDGPEVRHGHVAAVDGVRALRDRKSVV